MADCVESLAQRIRVIDLHCVQIRDQIDLSRTLLKRLNRLAHELQTTQAIAVENLIEAMEAITITEQYFASKQQTTLETRFQDTAAEWQEMLSLARDVMSEGSDFRTELHAGGNSSDGVRRCRYP